MINHNPLRTDFKVGMWFNQLARADDRYCDIARRVEAVDHASLIFIDDNKKPIELGFSKVVFLCDTQEEAVLMQQLSERRFNSLTKIRKEYQEVINAVCAGEVRV